MCIRDRQNIEAGLDMFGASQFDVVVSSMAIQATFKTESVLRDMSVVGREGVVSFPNFGHWYHAWSILRGRMPVSSEMPYQWYNTPNLHLATLRDFEDLLTRLGLTVTARAFLANGRPVHALAGDLALEPSLLPSLPRTIQVTRFDDTPAEATAASGLPPVPALIVLGAGLLGVLRRRR